LGNPLPTSAYVDFLSFHHWSGADYLRNRMAYYRSQSGQPLLVEEVGRHTYSSTPPSAQAEAVQLEFFQSVIGAAEAEQAAGWVVWTAFDFFPPPGQPALLWPVAHRPVAQAGALGAAAGAVDDPVSHPARRPG
jgi:hypothetical protein